MDFPMSINVLQKPEMVNCNGVLTSVSQLRIMGILNVTPDSFYDGGRFRTMETIKSHVRKMVNEGVNILDVGGYSSRPGAVHISENEEKKRVATCLNIVREEMPELIISIDTFRSSVAEMALRDYNVDIINDISGGVLDHKLIHVVAKYNAAYILMHMQGIPQTMQNKPKYENVVVDVIKTLAFKIDELNRCGVKDVIVDPGFGFGKSIENNYALLSHLKMFNLLSKPILIGVSRKSMLHRLLNVEPSEALNATTATHMLGLQNGAHILRVHDVKEAKECLRIFDAFNNEW